MKSFKIMGFTEKSDISRGFTKKQYIGGLPKKGSLGQLDLREGLAKKKGWCFFATLRKNCDGQTCRKTDGQLRAIS